MREKKSSLTMQRLKLRFQMLRDSPIKIAIWAIITLITIWFCVCSPLIQRQSMTVEDRGVSIIRGNSMEPTIKDGDILYLAPLEFQRGEVVVVQCPPTTNYITTAKTALLKRIIGLPGEVVEITKDGVLINGELLNEDYVDDQKLSLLETNDFQEVILSDNEYFVLGDNRASSFDSRHVGPIHSSYFMYALTKTPNSYTMSLRMNEISKFAIYAVCLILIPTFTFLFLTIRTSPKTLNNSIGFDDKIENDDKLTKIIREGRKRKTDPRYKNINQKSVAHPNNKKKKKNKKRHK